MTSRSCSPSGNGGTPERAVGVEPAGKVVYRAIVALEAMFAVIEESGMAVGFWLMRDTETWDGDEAVPLADAVPDAGTDAGGAPADDEGPAGAAEDGAWRATTACAKAGSCAYTVVAERTAARTKDVERILLRNFVVVVEEGLVVAAGDNGDVSWREKKGMGVRGPKWCSELYLNHARVCKRQLCPFPGVRATSILCLDLALTLMSWLPLSYFPSFSHKSLLQSTVRIALYFVLLKFRKIDSEKHKLAQHQDLPLIIERYVRTLKIACRVFFSFSLTQTNYSSSPPVFGPSSPWCKLRRT